MTTKTTKLVAEPDLNLWGQILVRQLLLTMNCHALGTITAFDATNQSAQVKLNYKRIVNGEPRDYPPLTDCPVVILGGGGGAITFPIAAGDSCLVFFNDVNMDTWISSANTGAAPADARLHSFSDAIVLVGVNSFPQALASYFTDGIRIAFGKSKIELTDTIKLANDMTDLKTLINGLIDLIAAITVLPGTFTAPSGGGPVTGVSGAPVNASTITAYKTQIGELLT